MKKKRRNLNLVNKAKSMSHQNQWKVSEDCNTCAEIDEFGDKSTYYMTGNYNGCLWVTKGCSDMIMAADQEVKDQHEDCVGNSYNQEPSIGTEGEFCVCYKPESSSIVPAGQWVLPDYDDDEDQDADTIVEVYQSDFTQGTYRVLQPGIYKVMEDIEFEMNAGDHANPNEPGQWYPREDQEREDMGSKAFISGQGPANFGPYMVYANNVEIKNGVIGRSSHHGIHANGFEKLYVHDVVIRDFEVAGMALNGFVDARIENVEVGPVYQEVPVMGVFTQARIMLPRLRNIIENNPEGTVSFHNRPGKTYTANDLYDELVAQMDIMFD